jgi:hypothetical protein
MMKILSDSESWVLSRSNGMRLVYVMYIFLSQIEDQTFVTLPILDLTSNKQSAIVNSS